MPLLPTYIAKQTLKMALVIGMVLFAITLMTQLDLFLRASIERNIHYSFTIPIVFNSFSQYVGIIIPIAFFLGLVLTLGRLYSNSEIVTMHSCGMGLGRLYSGFVACALLATALSGYTNFIWAPHSAFAVNTIVRETERRDLFDLIQPGSFIELVTNPSTVLFATAGDAATRRFSDVFVIRTLSESQYHFIFAASAEVVFTEGVRTLLLSKGYQITSSRHLPQGHSIEFARLTIKLPNYKPLRTVEQKEFQSMVALWQSSNPQWLEHFYWRVALVLTVPTLLVAGLLIGKVAPRKSAFVQMLPACVLVVIYQTLLVMVSQVAQDGVLPVYATILVSIPIIGLTWLWRWLRW